MKGLVAAGFVAALLIHAETPKTATSGAVESYTATTANVSGAPDKIRIEILRWSTDSERDKLMDAWNLKNAETGRGGRGGAGRGGSARGGAGRGGRGGADATPAPKPSPEAMLEKALKESTTVGYLWSQEVAGYAIRYAARTQNPDGSARIILLTDRRLGAVNDLWKPVGSEPSPYGFSLIEVHLKANGDGEGKASLSGKIAVDTASKAVALADYDSLPVVFTHVQRHAPDRK
jgi:hypothetical protein